MHPDWIRPEWPAPANVCAVSTTRAGGCSAPPWDSMNLGAHCGDDPAAVRRNRERLVADLPAEPLWLRQVHGAGVVSHPGAACGEPQADAAVAGESGRVCAVLTADCLPVLLCNREGSRVAAAHAGWRGLAAGALEATVRALGGEPAELLAWLGPAIGPSAYEVGGEVVAAFPEQFPAGFERSGERWRMDLYELARLRLKSCGVNAVFGGGHCTLTERARFFSYRRDGRTGRMATLIWRQ